MSHFTLDDLNKALEAEYGPFVFSAGKEKFSLRHMLRLEQADRKAVEVSLTALEGRDDLTEDEVLEAVQFVIRVVTADGRGDRLIEILGNNILHYNILLEKWMEKSQPGEA